MKKTLKGERDVKMMAIRPLTLVINMKVSVDMKNSQGLCLHIKYTHESPIFMNTKSVMITYSISHPGRK